MKERPAQPSVVSRRFGGFAALCSVLLLAGCPGGAGGTAVTAAPASAAPAAKEKPTLELARRLLTPYDPGGTSRDAVTMLLGLARDGDTQAFALLARTYVDWTAYAAYAGDVPLLTLLQADLGVPPGVAPFPLPPAYVQSLRKLARAGGIDGELEPLLAAWARHDLSTPYWESLGRAVGAAPLLWALMDCEGSLRSASRLPAGLGPWYFVKGCARRHPTVLPALVDSDASERLTRLREVLGCGPAAEGTAATVCGESLGWPSDRAEYLNAQTAAVIIGLLTLADIRRELSESEGPLLPFADAALVRRGALPRIPAAGDFVTAFPAGPGLPTLARTAYGRHDERSRLLLVLTRAETRLSAKPVIGLDADLRPVVDLGIAEPYPGELLSSKMLASRVDVHAREWEARGLGAPLAGMPTDRHARAISLVVDVGVTMARLREVLNSLGHAGVRAHFFVSRRYDDTITEVPIRVALIPGRPPPPPVLNLDLDGKAVKIAYYRHDGTTLRARVPHGRKGAPNLPKLLERVTELLGPSAHPPLHVRAAGSVSYGHLFDVIDALRYWVPGAPFATAAAFDVARLRPEVSPSAPDAGLPRRDKLVGSVTLVFGR